MWMKHVLVQRNALSLCYIHTHIQVYAACVCIESTLDISPSVSYTLTPQSMHISLAL